MKKSLKTITFLVASCISMRMMGMSAIQQQQVTPLPVISTLAMLNLLEITNPTPAIPAFDMSVEEPLFFNQTNQTKTSTKKYDRSHHAHTQTAKIHYSRKQTSNNVHQPDKNGKRIFPGKNAKK